MTTACPEAAEGKASFELNWQVKNMLRTDKNTAKMRGMNDYGTEVPAAPGFAEK